MNHKKKNNTKNVERNIHLDIGNQNHYERIEKLGKALSSSDRIKILDLLRIRSMSVVEVANTLHIPVSSVAHHFKTLEEAGLVLTESRSGVRGSMRIGLCCVQQVTLKASSTEYLPQNNTITVDMPLGNYFDCDIQPTCGLAGEKELIGVFDSTKDFFSPQRHAAQLIWFQYGYLEYRFPNYCTQELTPSQLSFSLELCSEAPGYQERWPSDISFYVNGLFLGTYTAPGDFGERRGLLTPDYWTPGSTQYGLLKTLTINSKGGFIDGQSVNDSITLNKLNLYKLPFISFRIEVNADSPHPGGINIFGEKFGDYKQNIVMRITHNR